MHKDELTPYILFTLAVVIALGNLLYIGYEVGIAHDQSIRDTAIIEGTELGRAEVRERMRQNLPDLAQCLLDARKNPAPE